jgi:hypothetical protein
VNTCGFLDSQTMEQVQIEWSRIIIGGKDISRDVFRPRFVPVLQVESVVRGGCEPQCGT